MRPRQPAGRAGLWTRASWWKRRTPGSVCWWCRPPPSHRPPLTGCEVVDAGYMIRSMLRAGRLFGIQNAVAVGREELSGVGRRSPAADPDWACAPFRIQSGLAFEFQDRGGRRVLPAAVFLCRSWLQMRPSRGSWGLSAAPVRTAAEVTTCWIPTSDASRPDRTSSLYTCPCAMTWTPCPTVARGQLCPTLTSRITSVEPICAAPKGTAVRISHLEMVRIFLCDPNSIAFWTVLL